jgi:hypothetical protein
MKEVTMSNSIIPPLPEITGVEIRHIKDWPGYAVSDDGRVFSCKIKGGKGTFLDDWIPRKIVFSGGHNSRYPTVVFSKSGTRKKRFYIHRLILEAFVGPCPKGLECCHENDNPSENQLNKLRWDTNKNNRSDMIKNQRSTRGTKHWGTILNENSVREIRQLAGTMTLDEIGKRFGVSKSNVHVIVHRKSWSWLP